ncbi:aspartate aminotransferase family protein [Emcibacter sp.]|uniref:aspartate aminotransferase family protein n=1 Tax=Emcibacter sp. TaxID=1979954 RepID=UPI002AA85745|nr:aspartate aminotransferase family protein [Emcibacter sp.]
MGQVFYRSPKHTYPCVARGQGVYLYDTAGKAYLDGSGGAAVSCLGHGNAEVIEAVREQVGKVAFAHTAFFTNEPQEQLAAKLAARFGEKDARVYFLSGGSEANETAVKLARQYWFALGQTERSVVISREQSYHGNTLGALSLSGNPGRRITYGPMLHDWPRIDPCYAYRHQGADETEQAYGQRCANVLETAILETGPEKVAAFIAEPVVGATLGVVPAAEGYFRRIREICDKYNILLILDEVMSGCGRTGSYFAFEQEGIQPDIISIAKGLGAGYQPLGATICRAFIHDAIVENTGSFAHGHTYVGHPTACAAGVAVMEVIETQGLLDRATATGEKIRAGLRERFADFPHVGDVRGRGMFIGIELVQDPETKEPPAPSLKLPEKLKNTAMDRGLICYPGGGTADGWKGAHILLAPPFIYEDRHVEELIDKLDDVIRSQKYI